MAALGLRLRSRPDRGGKEGVRDHALIQFAPPWGAGIRSCRLLAFRCCTTMYDYCDLPNWQSSQPGTGDPA
jgi:hypothetical protein